ncbi:unnamed protein product, partial [Gulo gulo]
MCPTKFLHLQSKRAGSWGSSSDRLPPLLSPREQCGNHSPLLRNRVGAPGWLSRLSVQLLVSAQV